MKMMTNNSTTIIEHSPDEWDSFKAACIDWFEGTAVPVVGSIGLVGNILSVIVLLVCDLDLKRSFINLLVTLCVFDGLFILAVNLTYTLPMHSRLYEALLIPYLSPFLLPVVQIALTGSVYSMIAVAMERYLIICKPDGAFVPNNSARYIIFIVIFSIVFNINKFFEFTTVDVDYERTLSNGTVITTTESVVSITDLRKSDLYLQISIPVNFIFMVVIPLIVLLFCHINTYKTIRKNTRLHNAISSHQRRDNAMAMLFSVIIAVFVICHSGKFILNFFEVSRLFTDQRDEEWPLWAFILTRTNHLLLVVNSSINFFIYCFRDAKFRNSAIAVTRCSLLKKDSQPTNNNQMSQGPRSQITNPRESSNNSGNFQEHSV